MKKIKRVFAIAITMLAIVSCQKDIKSLNQSKELPADESEAINALRAETSHPDNNNGNSQGHVYTLSNQTTGNYVMDYKRAANGTLTLAASYSAGGNGSGGGLGNQGAVILTSDDDDNMLLAVNAGSNTISSFKITGSGLSLKSTVSSGGVKPVSITENDGIVYVLNAGGDGNISGFRLGSNNKLTPIPNSTKPLSSNASAAAQISFVRNGRVLVITERMTNKIITYRVNEWGLPGAMHSITSATPTPFGFATDRFGNIYVSEAAGGAAGASTVSSYRVDYNGNIALADGPVGANQSAACWVVLTDDGRFAYATNTASNNLTSFSVHQYSGNLDVLHAIAATSQMGPIDAALSTNSRYLYVLNGGSHSISVYRVANNGGLNDVQTVAGLPIGANGLAAR